MARLKVGQIAPDFTVQDIKHTDISLADFKGEYTLLSFMRYAGCPFCDLTLVKLVERYENFASRGLGVVSFYQSPPETIEEYVVQRKPQFPLVADPDKVVYDLYGIESSKMGVIKSIPASIPVGAAIVRGKTKQGTITGDGFLMPAQFIVGPDLKLLNVHYGTDFGDKIPFFEIEEILLTRVTHNHPVEKIPA